jgi:hypothetical protein
MLFARRGSHTSGKAAGGNVPASDLGPDIVQKAGYVNKRGHWFKSWKMRYHVLRKDVFQLQYYDRAESKEMLGFVSIDHSTIVVNATPAEADGFAYGAFVITHSGDSDEEKFLVRSVRILLLILLLTKYTKNVCVDLKMSKRARNGPKKLLLLPRRLLLSVLGHPRDLSAEALSNQVALH